MPSGRVHRLAHRARLEPHPASARFDAPRTIPVMVSRGCSHGRCSFCAEGIGSERASVLTEFGWLADLIAANRDAAFYFQDSIFPNTPEIREKLLPLLRRAAIEWGCQVYLPMLSRRAVRELAAHGCRYVYTGLESGSDDILRAIGKTALNQELLRERLGWIRDAGMRLGLSVMFGAMNDRGQCIETEASIAATVELCERIVADGVEVAGFYPNVETVLPNTGLARVLHRSGQCFNWYRPPRTPVFTHLEDGTVGFNLMSTQKDQTKKIQRIVTRICAVSLSLTRLHSSSW